MTCPSDVRTTQDMTDHIFDMNLPPRLSKCATCQCSITSTRADLPCGAKVRDRKDPPLGSKETNRRYKAKRRDAKRAAKGLKPWSEASRSEHYKEARDAKFDPAPIPSWWKEIEVYRGPKAGNQPRYYAHAGFELTIPEWSKKTGIPPKSLYDRLRDGWSLEKALRIPAANRGVRRGKK